MSKGTGSFGKLDLKTQRWYSLCKWYSQLWQHYVVTDETAIHAAFLGGSGGLRRVKSSL